ncbi:MAG: cytochrome c3 family protein [Anaerolineae bacterium]|nr:cytochrome c3 family protein [Anaerolineae bacterium]
MNQRRLWIATLIALVIGSVLTWQAQASGPLPQGGPNEDCLSCHGNPDLTYEFPSGETWSLYVDQDAFHNSIHGQEELACTDCHTDIHDYPHPPLEANSPRFYALEQYKTCEQCHSEVYQQTLDSIHAREIASGNWDAAICTDCHDPHATTSPDEPRTAIPLTCSKCHSGIYNEYLDSVHGEALVDENNADVPTCIDCHGVHNQEDPRTTEFRLNSPNLCANCHADEALMSKYDISTHVFDTYVADFHGTTVTLFERQSPDMPTNKPVCYDCHGVHNMKSADDPESQVFKENILQTCQKCHPDATTNFSATWLGHYEPDVNKYPIVYFVDLFYKIFIPAVLGFMGLYVVADVSSNFVRRIRRHNKGGTE